MGIPNHRNDTISEDEIPRVKGCATMWHESSDEMAEMLKSIFRMDEDYSARYTYTLMCF